jgi:DNA-binding NarL/FixJ family response regulator
MSAGTREGGTRLLIVSDVLLYREGLCASLAGQACVQVVGATDGPEAVARAQTMAVDVVLLDASLPSGLALARELRRVTPEVRVVGFGVSAEDGGIVACAEAGLAGFVGSDGTAEELALVITQAVRGELRCSPRIAALLMSRVATLAGDRAAGAHPVLTRRERQIAVLIREGLSNKEIAAELRIGSATVKNYVHNLLEKFQVQRRSAIAARLR